MNALRLYASGFVICQTIFYLALSGQLFESIEQKTYKGLVKILDAVSITSMVLWTWLLLCRGRPGSAIDAAILCAVFARCIESVASIFLVGPTRFATATIVYLLQCMRGSRTTATIVSTVGVSIGRLYAATGHLDVGKLALVAVLGILHAFHSLPVSVSSKKLFLVLLLIPVSGIVLQAKNGAVKLPVTYITPVTYANSPTYEGLHPIEKNIAEAKMAFSAMVERQSKTLEEAVAEYKRRYHRPPPPHFDVWYDMATAEDAILLIDEFDTLMAPLEPFWGVPPHVIRERIDAAFRARRIHKFQVLNHKWVSSSTNTGRYAYVGIEMATWLQEDHLSLLPDLTFALNFWDEPRVYTPFEEKQRAMAMASDHTLVDQQQTVYGNPDSQMRFLKLEHRDAWEAMKLACPIDSPARSSPHNATVKNEAFLEFPLNRTAYIDICNDPVLATAHGFVLAPAAFDLTHTMIPLFSGGVPVVASDIIFPPAYTGQRLNDGHYEYDPDADMPWEDKQNSIYWKGSSTGGWATETNWRDLHRQRLSLKFTDTAKSQANATFLRQEPEGSGPWTPYVASLAPMASQFDIHIAGELVLCSGPRSRRKKDRKTGGCKAETTALNIAQLGSAQEAWNHKLVLDIDGNGYSGRFIRLLVSNSAVVKMTVFREWFNDWIVPWVHYIPARQDQEFSDLSEIVRFLTSERGDPLAKEVATMGQAWTTKIITKPALRLWFLRLMMEYGRVINDDRDNMNYVG